ncbi:MAG: polysaccharide biosynthesis/export family protein [Phycisphaerae bacterium]
MRRSLVAAVAVGTMGLLAGCESQSFMDPTQMGAYNSDENVVVPILDTLDPGLEGPDGFFTQARDVEESDLVEVQSDYEITGGDFLQLSISDLQAPGQAEIIGKRVSQSGTISLPLLDRPLDVSGLTEVQAEQAIREGYRDQQLIENAQVTVTVVERRGATYTITQTVAAPGQYQILESDYRLLDAIAAAGGIPVVTGIETIYVIRDKTDGTAGEREDAAPAAPQDPLAPGARMNLRGDRPVFMASNAMIVANQPATLPEEEEGRTIFLEGQEQPLADDGSMTGEMALPEDGMGDDGMAEEGMAEEGMTEEGMTDEAMGFEGLAEDGMGMDSPGMQQESFDGFASLPEPTNKEVIRVPYGRLKNGELKFNIVIRPGDYVIVPPPPSGFYYMGGNVARVGTYSLAGTRVTLMEAIIAAGMLNAVAIPQRTEIIRRLEGDRNMWVRVDLAKIFSGQEPDIYLQPNDKVMVGTNAIAPFLAIIRNSFRLTAGAGFLYDRNFAPARDDD